MKNQLTLALMLAAGLAVGCDQSDIDNAVDTLESAAEKTSETTGDVVDQAKEAGEKLVEQGGDAVEAGKEKAEEMIEAGKEKIDEMVGEADAGGISLDSLKAGEPLEAGQADSAFAQVTQLIKDQNFTDAEKWIAALEKVGLPEGYADKFASLKDTFNKAKEMDLGGAGELLKGIGG